LNIFLGGENGVFAGVLAKNVVQMMVFDGEFVVECW
jgi:hypothetical protein